MIGALQTILRVFIVEKKLKMWCQSNMNMTIGKKIVDHENP